MNSTDETHGEGQYGHETADSSPQDEFAPPRRRRSTYTPPPQYRDAVAPAPTESVDTMAAPSAVPAAPAPTTSIPDWNSVTPAFGRAEPAERPAMAPPANAEPLPSAPVWSLEGGEGATAGASVAEPQADDPWARAVFPPYVDEPPRATAPPEEHYRPWVPEPQPESTPLWEALFPTTPPAEHAASPAAPAPPVYMTPDDEAETLASHAPPAGQPWIPQRRSLPDDELLSVLEATDSKPGGTLDAMDALEREMRLREEEVEQYREWENSMLAVGTPEALAAVEQVRPEFTAIAIPAELTPTTAIPIQYPDADREHSTHDESDAPWPFSEPGEPEVPLLPEPPLQPQPSEPMFPTEPEAPVAPEIPAEPQTPIEPAPPVTPETPAEPQTDPTDVPHDMPQSWFDALAAPIVPTTAPEAQAPVAQHTGYPVPKFDDLLAQAPDAGPANEGSDEKADVAPEEKRKRPFGVAVADGQPQNPEAPILEAAVAPEPAPKRARTPLFALEQAGDRPTARDLRIGRASRMFWLWFAANSSVVSIALGATVFSLGMSLRQSIVAALIGVGLSLVPLGLGTLAGKRSGQPTVIVSRAAFGLVGNVVPAALAVLSRVFWGSVLLWLFAASVSRVIGGSSSTAGLVVVFIVVGVMLALVVAFLGYWLLARVQLVVSVISAVLIIGFVALTWQYVDLRAALTVSDGPWLLVVGGAVTVFSFLGLVWANSASDLARYQRHDGAGGANMLWAGFGATLPSFLLVGYGAVLAASDPALGARIVADPVSALTGILPGWYPVPLLVATGLSLLSGVIVSTYSGGFALRGIGLRVERQWATLLVGALVAVVAVGFSVLDVDLDGVFRDLATTIAVPVAAWAGIFAADTMIRVRPFHTASLLRIGGVYPTVNWVNLPALVLITALGWGLTTATVAGLGWQGYLFDIGGVDLAGNLAASDVGVLVALVLGLLTPIVSGIPAIRRQEAAGRPI